MAISLITHYEVYSAGADTSTLTTPSFTPANGEILVVKMATWDTGNGMSAPTGGSQTYQQINVAAPGGFAAWAGVWVATISGSPGSMTVSAAPATGSGTRHTMVVERWSGAQLAGSPATNSTIHGTTGGTTTLTTVGSGSIVSWVLVDENSRDPANTTYDSSSGGTVTPDGLYDGHSGSNSVQYFAYQTTVSTGSQTIGASNTGGSLNWTIAGVEVQAAVSTTPVSGSDTGSGTEATSSLSVTTSNADTGSGTDALSTLNASATLTDAASGSETSALISQTVADTAAGSESALISLTSSDTASGTEGSLQSLTSSDIGSGIEAVGAFSASQSASETATGVDAQALGASVPSGDTGTAVDVQATGASVSSSDTATGVEASPKPNVAWTSGDTAHGVEAEGVFKGSESVLDSDTATAIETETVTVNALPNKSRVYPYFIRATQPWAVEQERRNHTQALWSVGETTMFALMWHIEDFQTGLVGRCKTCYLSQGKISDVYGQSDQNKCIDCFGTTFDGGFKAIIVRPAIFSDTDEGETFHSRGVIHPNDLAIESTPDFRVRNGDYCFRATGERYYLRVPERITLRTGYGLPVQQEMAIGYNHSNAQVEDPTAVAYLIPPPQDEVNTILRRSTRIPQDMSSYEVIRAPLIPTDLQAPDA